MFYRQPTGNYKRLLLPLTLLTVIVFTSDFHINKELINNSSGPESNNGEEGLLSDLISHYALHHKCQPQRLHLAPGHRPESSITISFSLSRECIQHAEEEEKYKILAGVYVKPKVESTLKMFFTREVETPPAAKFYPSGADIRTYTHSDYYTGYYESDYYHHVHIENQLESDSLYEYECVAIFYHDKEDDYNNHISTARLRSSDGRKEMVYRYADDFLQNGEKMIQAFHSETAQFRTAPALTRHNIKPIEFAVVGDLGQTINSKATLDHIAREGSEVRGIIHAGDISYADGDQSRWESWWNTSGRLASKIQWMHCPGNHEIEIDKVTKEIFKSYQAIFAMPEVKPADMGLTNYPAELPNPSEFIGHYNYGNAFYSVNYGPAHLVFLNCYTSTLPNSIQYSWLLSDLENIDRRVTPWILVTSHCPLYDTFRGHHHEKQSILMKASMEKLFLKYGVNFVFAGHEHAYMRSKPLAHDKLNDNGPVYMIIGDGGNREGHADYYNPFEAEDWVAFRDNTTYGYGSLVLESASKATWKWVKDVKENHKLMFTHVDQTTISNPHALN